MKKICALLISVIMLISAVNVALGDDTPKLEMKISGNSAVISLDNAPIGVNAIQMEIYTDSLDTGYELSANNDGNYAIIKEKKDGRGIVLTVYIDKVKAVGGDSKVVLGEIKCPKGDSFTGKADLILLDRDLNPSEYKNTEIDFDGARRNTEVIENTTEMTTAESSETAAEEKTDTVYFTINADSGEGGIISPSGKANIVRGSNKEFTIEAYSGYSIKDVKVDGRSVGAVRSYTFENVTRNGEIYAEFQSNDAEEANGTQSAAQEGLFSDMNGHWAETAVNYLAKEDIVKGREGGYFMPNDNVTRAEFVTMLAKISGDDISGYTNSPFGDVDYDDWFMPYVEWARNNGIVTGVRDGVFAPKEKITREQMAFIITRFAEYKGYELAEKNSRITFADDEDIRAYSYESVAKAQMAGIINGNSDGKFYPESNATRAEASQMLYALMKH